MAFSCRLLLYPLNVAVRIAVYGHRLSAYSHADCSFYARCMSSGKPSPHIEFFFSLRSSSLWDWKRSLFQHSGEYVGAPRARKDFFVEYLNLKKTSISELTELRLSFNWKNLPVEIYFFANFYRIYLEECRMWNSCNFNSSCSLQSLFVTNAKNISPLNGGRRERAGEKINFEYLFYDT